jgi:dolichol-phosphate mannosyltransferase
LADETRMKNPARTLVVIPTYNESESLPKLLPALREAAPDVDILIVDDTSPDGTGKIADEFAAYDKAITVMHRAGREKGFAASYLDGFAWALRHDYDIIVEMDSDSSHRPEDLAGILAKLDDADLVLGSRWTKGGGIVNWPLQRQLLSRAGSLYARMMLQIPAKDITTGFRAYKAETLRAINLEDIRTTGYAFQVELAYRTHQAGLKIAESPIIFVERVAGVSKMSKQIVIEALVQVTRWGLGLSK